MNFGPGCGDLCPTETRAIDPIEPLQKLGYFTIWRANDHPRPPAHRSVPQRLVGAGGSLGPLERTRGSLDVKLIDWEKPIDAGVLRTARSPASTAGRRTWRSSR